MRSSTISLNIANVKLTAFTLLIAALAISTVNINAQKIRSTKSAAVPVTQEAVRETIEEKSNPEIITEQFQQPGDGSTDLVTAATYPFTPTNAVLDDMTTGTSQIVAPSLDDNASAVTNIGFDFWFDGVRYAQFSANANGLIRLGATAVTTGFTNNLASATDAPKIAAYNDDLCTGSNGKIHYKVTGTAPNRKLTVEFLNMQISRGAGCAGLGTGTFQAWLFESAASSNPGVIQFVYGAIPVGATATDGGYSVGLQSGAATNFASVTTSNDTVSYAAANNANATAIMSGKSYLFTPNVPIAPTALTFTATNAVSTTLNWTDNSTNEVGFAVYRSLDGVTYNFLAQTAANAVTYTDSGLTPSTNYFYRVYSVTEGALSPALAGSQATAAVGNDTCAGAGGNYSAAATWADGSVPTAGDNVIIQAGCTVTADTTGATALNLTINNGGALTAATGTTITIGGNLTNNGTLDLSPTNTAAGAGLVFTGASNNTFSGTGAINDILTISVNKGNSNANVLELTATNFTVQGVSTDVAGFLTLTNGTFKVSGTFTAANRTFTTAGYTIPATTGFWLNNPNYTVSGQNGSATESGLLRITQGTFNIGTATGNSMGFSTGSTVVVEGGAVNAAGRFGTAAVANVFTYTQTAGVITVQTVGNTSTTFAGFDLGTTLGSTITISGGTIVVQLASTATTTPIDYRNQAGGGIASVTGGTLQLGNANSGAAKAFNIRGVVPNLLITNTSGNHSATWGAPVNYNNISLNITISAGTTLNLGNQTFLFAGPTLTNNGTLTSNGASSNLVTFNAIAPVNYTGTGTVTTPLSNLSLQSDLGFIIDPASPNIPASNIRIFSGNVTNANKLTLGTGGATVNAVQFGNITTPTAAGTVDQPFTFNLGTGGQSISYLRTTASRTTGGEINPTRTLTALTYDDNDATHSLTVAGGNLTTTTTTLTNGRVITGANTYFVPSAGTVARTNGYIDGNLNKAYAAVGSKTFEVGTVNGYSPTTANVTAGTFPSSLTVKAVQQRLPGLVSSINRYWTLTEIGDLTADLTFTYLDADIRGDETTYSVFRRESGATAAVAGSTNNAATNTASAPGISLFSDWGIGTTAVTTAAGVQVSGRVTTANGSSIRNAVLTITNSHGVSRNVTTSAFGNYRFDNVSAGDTYLISVSAKGYTFAQPVQALTISDSLQSVDFTGSR